LEDDFDEARAITTYILGEIGEENEAKRMVKYLGDVNDNSDGGGGGGYLISTAANGSCMAK
jgi:hypothetical protein